VAASISPVPFVILLAAALFGTSWLYGKWRTLRRAEFIRTFRWPRGLLERLEKHRPGFERKDSALVSRGLRQFFLAYLMSGKRHVSMPSQVADDLWHEFILYTREYDASFTIRPPSSSASIARATKACAASGGIAANTRTSIRSARRACRCCLRSTASSISQTGSSTTPTARSCARTAAALRIAAAISQIRRSTAVRTGLAIPAATQAVIAAATAVVGATEAAAAAAGIEDFATAASPA
jgi:hypothetical protein